MTRLRHYDHLGTVRFITFSTYRRARILAADVPATPFLQELNRIRELHAIKILGYVIMPEHVHLVVHPPDGIKLGIVIGQMKARFANALIASWKEMRLAISDDCLANTETRKIAIWQRRCYDHNCRTPAIVIEKIEYCHKNPVQRGLVKEPADWPWSSYRWYMGMEGVLLSIDPAPPP